MKRSITLMVLAAFVLSVPSVALAGVATSEHDLRAGHGATIAAQDLCYACHIPHNAGGEKLWARATTGTFSGVQELCYSCHDGTTVVLGGTTVMDTGLEQHKNLGAADCSGDGACHDVHDNTNGSFLTVGSAGNSQCEACHATDPGAPYTNSYLDHNTAVANHPMTASFTCNSCHKVHGAEPQTDNALLPGTLTNPILAGDNTSGGYYGAMCIGCHNGAGVDGGGAAYSYPSATYAYDEATIDGTEQKHPTIATAATSPNWNGAPINGCDTCHDAHNPGASNEWLLLADNTDSAYCGSCHNGSTAPGTAGGGGGSHYTGTGHDNTLNGTASPALPWANEQDDAPKAGGDYASATTDAMTCQTCHSVHRLGVEGNFLRQANTAANEICSACHVDN